MEPIQLFIGFLLITGGISLMNSDDSESIEENGPMMVVESSVVSDKPVYKRESTIALLRGITLATLLQNQRR